MMKKPAAGRAAMKTVRETSTKPAAAGSTAMKKPAAAGGIATKKPAAAGTAMKISKFVMKASKKVSNKPAVDFNEHAESSSDDETDFKLPDFQLLHPDYPFWCPWPRCSNKTTFAYAGQCPDCKSWLRSMDYLPGRPQPEGRPHPQYQQQNVRPSSLADRLRELAASPVSSLEAGDVTE